MSTTEKPDSTAPPSAGQTFENQARQQAPGLVREFFDFVWYNKAWWLIPIIVVLLLVGLLLVLGATSLAPFIYPFV